ncbi:putative deacetylase LmbE-like domain-containing protein [Coniella lustricola]|uniref:N-acetylglucosaminylphosphatidylinositol deacetylase n=1 Tax=Coniella lustricola TaxID=2025994 RepID=A0A2T2ZVH8_9PEZI|nr:putative deacetylase LmbE-like domain-containing protein [Coniella lustricola]
MDTSLLSLSLLVLLVPTLYLYTVSTVASSRLVPRNKRICLLIAHPDDEAMFFAPTVLALTQPHLGNHVKILCLSSGDAAGLGETRKKELVASGLVLGLRKPEDVYVVDNPGDFPDSMTVTWSADLIASLLRDAFAPSSSSSSSLPSQRNQSQSQTPTATIDILITFDQHGISSHPNHISLYHGARAFVSSLMTTSSTASSSKNDDDHNKNNKNKPPVDLYTLTTVNVVRKYAGILDALSTLVSATLVEWRKNDSSATSPTSTKTNANPQKDHPSPKALIFMHGLGKGGWLTAREAMTRAHLSQMVWFRYGWITLSRYMFMNDLRLESFGLKQD